MHYKDGIWHPTVTDDAISGFFGNYRFLSNFYPAKVVFNGIHYQSSEAAYMAQKTDDIKLRKIIATVPANQAKVIGRNIRLRDGWDNMRLAVMLDDDTVWLSQAQMVELFGRERSVITKHIRKVIADGELDEKEVSAKFAHTTKHGAIEGKTQTTDVVFYNLDMIISVGYRVNSKRGVEFRKWATRVLKDHLIKGYSLNEQRLAANMSELDAALALIKKTSQSPELTSNNRVANTNNDDAGNIYTIQQPRIQALTPASSSRNYLYPQ